MRVAGSVGGIVPALAGLTPSQTQTSPPSTPPITHPRLFMVTYLISIVMRWVVPSSSWAWSCQKPIAKGWVFRL